MADEDIKFTVGADASQAESALDSLFNKESAQAQQFANQAQQSFNQFTNAANSAASSTSNLSSNLGGLGTAFNAVSSAASATASSISNFANQAGSQFTNFAGQAVGSIGRVVTSISALSLAYLSLRIGKDLFDAFDHAREAAIKIEQLSNATGESVKNLAMLKNEMEDVGAPSDKLEQALSRLTRNMEAARVEGSKQAQAFHLLGVSTKGWAQELPSPLSVLQQVAIHLADSKNKAQDLGEVQVVLGRTSIALTSFLMEQGAALTANLQKHNDYATALENSVDSARKLTKAQRELGESWETFILGLLPQAVAGIQYFHVGLIALGAGILKIAAGVKLFGTDALTTFYAVGTAADLALKGKFKEIGDVTNNLMLQYSQNYSAYGDRITAISQKVAEKLFDIMASPPKPRAKDPTGDTDTNPNFDDKKGRQRQEKELQGEMEHQVAMLTLQRTSLEEESRRDKDYSDAKLKSIQALNSKIIDTQKSFYDQMIAIERDDPNGIVKVQDLLNKKQAAIDRANQVALTTDSHFADGRKRAADELEKAYESMVESMIEAGERERKRGEALTRQMLDEGRAASARLSEDAQRASLAKISAEEKSAQATEEIYRRAVDAQFNIGLISLSKRDALLQGSFDKETRMQKTALDTELKQLDQHNAEIITKRQGLVYLINNTMNVDDQENYRKELTQLDQFGAQYVSKRQEILNRVKALEDRELAQRSEAETRHLTVIAQRYQTFFSALNSSFGSHIQSLIRGQETFRQAFLGILGDMVSGFINALVQMGLKWAEQKAVDLAISLTTNATKVTADEASYAAAAAAGHASTMALITDAAALSAANTFASISAIPIVGPELAPAAAAAAETTVLGFEALAFAKGGIVPSTQMALVHQNEMILPPNLSQGMQNIINNGGTSNSRGGDTIHAPFSPQIHEFDSEGVDRVLTKQRSLFIRHLNDWARNRHLAYS